MSQDMQQAVIRVLWPQSGQPGSDWRCEYGNWSSEGSWEPSAISFSEACGRAAVAQTEDEMLAVTVILPAEMALLQNVQLPARNQRQALQALPFVVEEQLADDIEKVHLAVGSRRTDGSWPVLVIDLAIMTALMECCEKTNLRLKAVHVDAQMLAVSEGNLVVAMYENRVLLHMPKAMAAFETSIAADMIHFFLGESVPSHVMIRYSDAVEEQNLLAQQLATEFGALGEARVDAVSGVDELCPVLLSAIDKSGIGGAAINLLQGRFTVRQPTGKFPVWRWVAGLLVFLWLGQCVLQVASGFYFNHRAEVMEKNMEAQYRKLFPDARRFTGIRKQLESRLLESASANNGDSFAKLFSNSIQVLNALTDHEGLVIEELSYDSQQGQLEFEVKARSIDQLDQYKQALGKAGLSAKISSANDSDGSISGRMQINRGL